MKRALCRIIVVLCPLAIGVALAAEPAQMKTVLPDRPDAMLTMYADEPAMHRAIRKARAELADFLELAESPQKHQAKFAVRVSLRERNQGEVIWITGFKQDDNGLFAGNVDDDIVMPSRFKRGDRFTFVRGDILDWTWTDTRKGRIHGAYTECALMTLAPADVAAKYRKKRKPDCEF